MPNDSIVRMEKNKRYLTNELGYELNEQDYGYNPKNVVVHTFGQNEKIGKIQHELNKQDFNFYFVDMLFGRSEIYEKICFDLDKNRVAVFCTIKECYEVVRGNLFHKLGDEKENYYRAILKKEPNKKGLFNCQKMIDKIKNPLKHCYRDIDWIFREFEKIESYKKRKQYLIEKYK